MRAALIERVLSEPGIRAAARLRRMVAGSAGVQVFLQLDDARSLLLAQVVASWVRAGLACQLIVVPPPDRAYDPEPERRVAHDAREVPRLAAAFGLRWDARWQRPPLAVVAAAQAVLLAESALTAERYLELVEPLWAGAPAAQSPSATAPLSAGEGALRLELARRQLLACGHYQAPLISIDSDPYFGVMRLEDVADRLRERGCALPTLSLAPAAGWPAPARRPEQLTMFHSFRSPYSYLALERAARLAAQHGLTLQLKPVLPMVMRGLDVPLAKRLYIARDAARQARRHGIPFGRITDPLGPGIAHCMALFVHAAERGKEVALCQSLARGIWAQALSVTAVADLALMVERAGLRWSDASSALADRTWMALAERNREQLLATGLWGVPSFTLGELAWWGQDRLPLMDAWLAGS